MWADRCWEGNKVASLRPKAKSSDKKGRIGLRTLLDLTQGDAVSFRLPQWISTTVEGVCLCLITPLVRANTSEAS